MAPTIFWLLVLCLLIGTLVAPSVSQACNVADGSRKECGLHGINNSTCIGRGCCWVSSKISGIPWCFYNSSLSSILKSTKVCEHTGPAKLECSETERVDVLDAFYGRNGDDGSCHGHSSMTCSHPNATDIVRNICKMNSTCNVPSFGDFWNFRKDCDDLNAQLKVHYICVPKGRAPSTQIEASSTIYRPTPSQTISFNNTGLYSTAMLKSTSYQLPVTTMSQPAESALSTTFKHAITSSFEISSQTCSQTADSNVLRSLQLKLKRKDNVIIGLSVALSIIGILAAFSLFLLRRKKESQLTEPGGGAKIFEQEMGKTNCYEVMDMASENPYYEST